MRVNKELLACDFCGKTQDEVTHLIRALKDLCICNECTDLCHSIVHGEAVPVTPADRQGFEPWEYTERS